jgi:hypothetical protein
MATIINNTAITFSPSAQQAIRNAMANADLEKVYTAKNSTDGGNDTLFDLYDEEENYAFSIDLDGDVIWSK